MRISAAGRSQSSGISGARSGTPYPRRRRKPP